MGLPRLQIRVEFLESFHQLQREAHSTAVAHGWWEEPRSIGDLIALTHSEVSEMLGAVREGNPLSQKVPQCLQIEEEAADVIIRLMDMAQQYEWDLAGAILAKMEYNDTRPYRHGGKKL